ncbi:ABC transporter permease [Verticiella sediminum]|uniref:ABC transporter permease n=1 Tax=Verticiella sediminum TaxID=1247510 RepID=A0A556A975_9BURK|nr:ABC transporter permease [Verticiella sediminum]TSH89448.1 ABC transporter permease [Verticiella sediminum]
MKTSLRSARHLLITVLGLALAWESAVRVLDVPGYYLPALSVIFQDAWSVRGLLATSLGHTLLEAVLGFLLGAAFGFACGVLFAHVRMAERAFFPLFVAAKTVPVIAFGALVVIWFGNTLMAKVAIAFYLTFFPVTVNTLRGLQACDAEKVGLLRSFGATDAQLFLRLKLPTALPTIMVGLRLGISLSLIGAIVGEWFGATVGLGAMLIQAMYNEQVTRLWLIVLACGTAGASLYGIIAALERRFIWWQGRA